MSINKKDIGKGMDGCFVDGRGKEMGTELSGNETPLRSQKRGRMETSPTLNMSLTDSGKAKDPVVSTPKNVSVLSFLWDEEERRSIKKPREGKVDSLENERRGSPSLGRKMGDKAASLIKSAESDLREMRRLVVENPNTKKEIKSLVKSLSSILSQLCTREILDNLKAQEESRKEVIMVEETMDATTQTERSDEPTEEDKKRNDSISIGTQTSMGKPETKEVEVQTDLGETPRLQGTRENGPLRSLDTYDPILEWKEIVRRRWYPEAYKRTETKESGDILETKDAVPKIIFVAKGTNKQPNVEIWRRFPELLTIEEDYVVLEQTTNIKTGNSRMATRKIIRINTDGSEESLWQNLCRVREETAGQERVAFLPLLGKTTVQLRKMIECILHDSETSARLYTGPREGPAKKAARQTPRKGIREKDTCALVVEGTKRESYTDILKRVKEKVGGSTASNKIRGLRSTRDGRLLITMEKDEAAAGRVLEILGEAADTLKVAKVGQRKREVTLHVRGMDALATKQDVILAVEGKVGPLRGRTCRLSELRPNMGNTRAVTVVMDKEDVDKLLSSGPLRIGCVNCQVEKRVEVARCYKCWEYTHRASECRNNVDMSGKCYKCGEEGHNAKVCTKEDFCPVCVRGDHKADTAKCPVFRKALWSAKEKERERRANRTVRQLATELPTTDEEGLTEIDGLELPVLQEGLNGHKEQGPGPLGPEEMESEPGAEEDNDESGRGETDRPHD